VLGVFTGKDLAADKIGTLVCGWMIHSKDGSPMRRVASRPRGEKVRYASATVSRLSSPRRWTRRAMRRACRGRLRALPVAVIGDRAEPGSRSSIEQAPNNTVYDWHLGDKAPTEAAFAKAAHVTKIDLTNNRLIPNAMEPRAAIGDYDRGTGGYTLYTTSQNPHVARLVLSAFIGIAPENKLRVIAPDVGGGFGSKIFIYAEESGLPWAAKKVGRPVKWVSDRTEAFLCRRAWPRSHHACRAAIDQTARFSRCASAPRPISAPICRPSRRRCRPISTRRCLSGQYDIPAIYCEVDGVYTNTAPVDAYRGAGRPEATFVIERVVEVAAREMGIDPAEFRRAISSGNSRTRRRCSSTYDAGDYPGCLKMALKTPITRASRPQGAERESAASCAASASPPISRPAASRRRRRSARSARAWACGNPPKCACNRSARSRC
jgi:carbon-monoxide dehydrogenase large subunit